MNDSTTASEPLDVDVLIGRLIDGEADDHDRRRFDARAENDPTLWQRLAIRQLDGVRLADQVEQATGFVERISLPAPSRARVSNASWAAISGWAAVLIVGLSWALVTLSSAPAPRFTDAIQVDATPSIDHESHFDRYLEAPYVIGQLQPLVLDVQEMSDGRLAINLLRRIEEVVFVDPDQPVPVDDDGALLEDARDLRRSAPANVN